MVRVARRGGDGSPRRRWPWTVAAVALASVSAAVARAWARRRGETAGEAGKGEGVGDRPDALAAARQKATAVAAAKLIAGRAVRAAKDTPRVVAGAVSRLKGKAARRWPDRPGQNQTATEAVTSREPDTAPAAPPGPTADSPRSGEPDSA